MTLIAVQKNTPQGTLLILTDKNILGKKFVEGKAQLDLSKEFYVGTETTREEAKKLIGQARHIHLTGKEAVALAVEMDLVSVKHILFVQKVPHAEAVMADS